MSTTFRNASVDAMSHAPNKHSRSHSHNHAHDHSDQPQAVTPTVENSAAFLLPHLTSDMQILDAGCGNGTVTLGLAKHIESLGGSANQVHGIDVNEDGVGASKKNANEANLDTKFTVASADALPFDDNSFDVAYASQSLHHMPDPIVALQELARVVRPGGIIAARELDFGTQTWYPPLPGLSRWRAISTIVADLDGVHTTSGRQLLTWFHRASLSDATFTSSTWSYASTEDRRGMADVWIDRTSREDWQRDAARALGDIQEGSEDGAEQPGKVTREAIQQIHEGWNTWAETPGAIFVMPHFEVTARVK